MNTVQKNVKRLRITSMVRKNLFAIDKRLACDYSDMCDSLDFKGILEFSMEQVATINSCIPRVDYSQAVDLVLNGGRCFNADLESYYVSKVRGIVALATNIYATIYEDGNGKVLLVTCSSNGNEYALSFNLDSFYGDVIAEYNGDLTNLNKGGNNVN